MQCVLYQPLSHPVISLYMYRAIHRGMPAGIPSCCSTVYIAHVHIIRLHSYILHIYKHTGHPDLSCFELFSTQK